MGPHNLTSIHVVAVVVVVVYRSAVAPPADKAKMDSEVRRV